MKQVFNQRGKIIIEEVPAPSVAPGEVLVEVLYSCISTGTEISVLGSGSKSIIKKALEKPENIRKALDMVREKGIADSYSRITSRLGRPMQMGYSASGTVKETGEDAGDFKPGDMVACAGAGIANHAEYISVPKNLLVKIPDGLSLKEASTVALGAIALQGVRRCRPQIGEFVVVVGLGILGIMTLQMLGASGCRMIGVDIDQSRLKLAEAYGLLRGINAAKEDAVNIVNAITGGFGADAVIITAASKDETLINQAVKFCRRKGRIIVVGDVKLEIEREEFYKKELDMKISTSYGPGRYDDRYELKGFEYPYSYIRWTENRNMQEYIRLLSENKLIINNLIGNIFSVDKAPEAYDFLKSEAKPLVVLLEYPSDKDYLKKTVLKKQAISASSKSVKKSLISTAFIGAGSFTQEVHLPNLKKLAGIFNIHAICCKEGNDAQYIAKNYGAEYAVTDYRTVLEDKETDLVFITTRHDLHSHLAVEAINAGKAVFVEKPMAVNSAQLAELAKALKEKNPIFTVGFNRRYSPYMLKIREMVSKRISPLIISYRMNAGFIPKEHWVHTEEGGGRNIGEACHIYDIFNFLTDAEVTGIDASSIETNNEKFVINDNFAATIKYADGSVCNLIYTALGAKNGPKEQMDIYFDEKIISMNDYCELVIYDNKIKNTLLKGSQDKGHFNELEVLGKSIITGNFGSLIPVWQLIQATEISFEVEKKIFK